MTKLRSRRSGPFFLIPVVAVWASVFITQSCRNDNPENIDFNTESKSALYEHENFVGSESCKTCHQPEYDQWYTSHHAKAMAEANDSTVLGDFNDTRFRSKGITSTFFKNGEKYMVNTIGGEGGGDGSMQDFEIAYTFGITPLQQYLVRFPDGRLQTLHLSWDSDKG